MFMFFLQANIVVPFNVCESFDKKTGFFTQVLEYINKLECVVYAVCFIFPCHLNRGECSRVCFWSWSTSDSVFGGFFITVPKEEKVTSKVHLGCLSGLFETFTFSVVHIYSTFS